MAYDFKNSPLNPEAKPLYNDSILKFWNWFDTVWNCSDWQTWHQTLRKWYSKTAADNKFLNEWNNMATGSTAIDCRTFNTNFRQYFSSVGLLDALYSGLGVIVKPVGAAGDVVTAVGNTASTTARTIQKIIPILIIIGVVFLILYASKKTNLKLA